MNLIIQSLKTASLISKAGQVFFNKMCVVSCFFVVGVFLSLGVNFNKMVSQIQDGTADQKPQGALPHNSQKALWSGHSIAMWGNQGSSPCSAQFGSRDLNLGLPSPT